MYRRCKLCSVTIQAATDTFMPHLLMAKWNKRINRKKMPHKQRCWGVVSNTLKVMTTFKPGPSCIIFASDATAVAWNTKIMQEVHSPVSLSFLHWYDTELMYIRWLQHTSECLSVMTYRKVLNKRSLRGDGHPGEARESRGNFQPFLVIFTNVWSF